MAYQGTWAMPERGGKATMMSYTKMIIGGVIGLAVIAALVVVLSTQQEWRRAEADPAVVGNDIGATNAKGVTPLMVAALNGDQRRVQDLLNRGADVNAKDKDQETALMAASFNGHREIVELLLKSGADTKWRSKTGWTALELAQRRGHREVRELLAQHGAR